MILAAKLMGIKCVCHIRQTRKLIKIEKVFARWVSRFILTNNDAIPVYAQDIPSEKLSLIFNGIDLKPFESIPGSRIRHEFGLGNAFVVGLVGRIAEGKGHDVFMKAAAMVLKSKKEIRFLIVGSDSARDQMTYQALLKLQEELKLQNDLIFTGWRKDIPGVIQQLDVVVQATTTFPEGFGLTCIEAMALKKPVVATKIPGPKDIVVDHTTGLLVDPNNPQQLADSIIYLIDHPKEARSMGQEGRRRVEELFDIKKNIKQVEEIYEELSNK
jgi:glycosyltransferase involved in cell wall biosynthesis